VHSRQKLSLHAPFTFFSFFRAERNFEGIHLSYKEVRPQTGQLLYFSRSEHFFFIYKHHGNTTSSRDTHHTKSHHNLLFTTSDRYLITTSDPHLLEIKNSTSGSCHNLAFYHLQYWALDFYHNLRFICTSAEATSGFCHNLAFYHLQYWAHDYYHNLRFICTSAEATSGFCHDAFTLPLASPTFGQNYHGGDGDFYTGPFFCLNTPPPPPFTPLPSLNNCLTCLTASEASRGRQRHERSESLPAKRKG